MANKTGWSGGRLFSGLGWNALFGSELATLANGSAVLSSIVVTNGTGLDQLIDLSFVGGMASSSPAAGAGVSFWLAMLAADGTTYGDGRLTSTPSAYTPPWFSFAFIPSQVGAAITSIIGSQPMLAIPPGSFKMAAQNNMGFALTSGQLYGRAYDQDLNA